MIDSVKFAEPIVIVGPEIGLALSPDVVVAVFEPAHAVASTKAKVAIPRILRTPPPYVLFARATITAGGTTATISPIAAAFATSESGKGQWPRPA
jgi:hypothetical protein